MKIGLCTTELHSDNFHLHFWEMSPFWYFIRVVGDHFVVWLAWIILQSELSHLYFCVAQASV